MKLFSQAYFALPLLTTLLPRLTHAKTHIVTVGAYMFYFTPDIITADVGDYVEFQFPGESHSVVRAAYSQPCGPGVDTHSTSDGRNMSVWSGSVGGLGQFNTWTIEINDTDPIWYYSCNHCPQSMVGVINPPSVGGTLKEWKDNYQVVMSGAGRPIPQSERCPEGEMGGLLAKKPALSLVDPVGPSATATPRDGEAPAPTDPVPGGGGEADTSDSGAWKLGVSEGVVTFAGVLGMLALYGWA